MVHLIYIFFQCRHRLLLLADKLHRLKLKLKLKRILVGRVVH